MIKKVVCAVGLFLLPLSSAWALDLFSGTFEIRDGKPLLVRCDLVRNTYILVDQNHSSAKYLKMLTKMGVAPGAVFQARVIADVEVKGDVNTLIVDSIDAVKKGSCHLSDLLK